MKNIRNVFIALLFIFSISACSKETTGFDCTTNKYKTNPIANVNVAGYGTMKIELFINKAPQSVTNFIELANAKYYNGLNFHRLDKDLGILQGGDPNKDGTGGPDYNIKGEFASNKHCNDSLNEENTIAMARSQENDSAGSQFYFNFKNNSRVLMDYAVFGKIIEGQDILKKLSQVETKDMNGTPTPKKELVITSITIDKYTEELPKLDKIK